MASTPEFRTADGREVKFVACEFPGDESFILAGAQRVARKAGVPIDASALVSGLHSGRYWGFRILIDGECVGGSVTEIERKRQSGDELLHVWLLWGVRIKEWLSPGLLAARQLALDSGCVGVRLGSSRWGWIKLLPKGRLSWVLEL